MVLFHLKAGEQLPEHKTRGSISVECLAGDCTLEAVGESVEIAPAVLVGLPPGAPHSVSARTDTLLLVTISEQVGP